VKKIIFCLILILMISGCDKAPEELKDAIVIDESAVAVLSLVSYDGKDESKYGLMNLGHTFLTILNVSSADISVYGVEISPSEEITFSAWNTSLHAGVWFNIESAYIHEFDRYASRYSLSYGLSLEDIGILNSYISENDIWTPRKNCSYFSINLWNTVVDDNSKLDANLVTTPAGLKKEIMLFEGYTFGKAIAYNEAMGYFKDSEFREYRMEE